MESSCSPPTSSTNFPSRRVVILAARGRDRCWRSRKSAVTARRGTAGRDMPPQPTIHGKKPRALGRRLFAAQSRIEEIAERVADQIEGQHGQHDGEPRERRDPGTALDVLAALA